MTEQQLDAVLTAKFSHFVRSSTPSQELRAQVFRLPGAPQFFDVNALVIDADSVAHMERLQVGRIGEQWFFLDRDVLDREDAVIRIEAAQGSIR